MERFGWMTLNDVLDEIEREGKVDDFNAFCERRRIGPIAGAWLYARDNLDIPF